MPTHFPSAKVSMEGSVYRAARLFATAPQKKPAALAIGSSVIELGLNTRSASTTLRLGGVPATIVQASVFGANVTDIALLAHGASAMRPWLVIYGVAARDFKGESSTTYTSGIFYDSAVDFDHLPRTTVDEKLSAIVKRHWKLYRYRPLVRDAIKQNANLLLHAVVPSAYAEDELPPPSEPAGVATRSGGRRKAPQSAPPEASKWFDRTLISAESFALWQRWRESGTVEDYIAYLASRHRVLLQYRKHLTVDPDKLNENAHGQALAWMLDDLSRRGTRAVIAYFPENPLFRDPAATEYFDPEGSDAIAALLAREAAAHGARFVDLRYALEPEDFYDMVHPNLVGRRKISALVANIVAEEWRAGPGRGDGAGDAMR
jgi:hypothetical protein